MMAKHSRKKLSLERRAHKWAVRLHGILPPAYRSAWYKYRVHDWLMAAWLAGHKAGKRTYEGEDHG